MKKFIEKIEKICKENEKVAMFIDMDGTITVYDIYPENMVNEKMQEEYSQAEPAQYIIDILEKVNHIPNLDLYILSLSRTVKITKEKKKWLKKYIPFIEEANWIIITNMENEYNYFILLDDDHKILKEAQKLLDGNINVFHISSALV